MATATLRPRVFARILRSSLSFLFVAVALPARGTCTAVSEAEADTAEITVAELKEAYLACDRRSTSARLDSLMLIACGQIADALLHKGFEGDFDRQLAWWREATRSQLRPHSTP